PTSGCEQTGSAACSSYQVRWHNMVNSHALSVLFHIQQASALSILNFRIKGLEFGTCVVDFKLPITPALFLVPGRRPRGSFRGELLNFAKPAVVYTLPRQRTPCVFRAIEPTAMVRRLTNCEPPDQVPCLLGGERLVKRAHRVGV